MRPSRRLRGLGARARRDERGGAAVELGLALGLLLLPVGLLVAVLPAWPERQTVARAAATEAARTAVLADSWEEGTAAGEAAVVQAAANQGLGPGDVAVTWSGALGRGADVTARVTVRMPAVRIPGLATLASWSWSASHTERVDDYRSISRGFGMSEASGDPDPGDGDGP